MCNSFKLFIIICGLQINSFTCFSQNNYSYNDDNFELSVRQIDEFMERFNKLETTPLILYLNKKNPGFNAEIIDRKKYIINLFNIETIIWDTTIVKQFINQVADSANPVYLSFYDNDWYTLLKCKVLYKKRIKNLELILKTERAQNNSAKWVIVSAKADFLKFNSFYDSTKIPMPVYRGTDIRDSLLENEYFLNPMAHGTDFMSVEEAFDEKGQFTNYLYAGIISPQITLLIQALRKKQLVFKYVTSVSYHFMQVPGWLFICENFNRNTPNSGWLISNLYLLNDYQKKIYLQQYLNVPLND